MNFKIPVVQKGMETKSPNSINTLMASKPLMEASNAAGHLYGSMGQTTRAFVPSFFGIFQETRILKRVGSEKLLFDGNNKNLNWYVYIYKYTYINYIKPPPKQIAKAPRKWPSSPPRGNFMVQFPCFPQLACATSTYGVGSWQNLETNMNVCHINWSLSVSQSINC